MISEERYQKRMERFERVCRERGLKLTHQRRIIFSDLASHTDHPSAETVHKRVRKDIPSISLDTVYRTLSTFEELGLAFRVQAEGGQARFDAGLAAHHHAVCTRCRRIFDFDWEAFDGAELPEGARGWGHVEGKHAVLTGVCHECRENGESS